MHGLKLRGPMLSLLPALVLVVSASLWKYHSAVAIDAHPLMTVSQFDFASRVQFSVVYF
jgi:hypothetical protein